MIIASFVYRCCFDRFDWIHGRGLIVLLAGGGILQKPVASNTGNNSRTRPGMLPSTILL